MTAFIRIFPQVMRQGAQAYLSVSDFPPNSDVSIQLQNTGAFPTLHTNDFGYAAMEFRVPNLVQGRYTIIAQSLALTNVYASDIIDVNNGAITDYPIFIVASATIPKYRFINTTTYASLSMVIKNIGSIAGTCNFASSTTTPIPPGGTFNVTQSALNISGLEAYYIYTYPSGNLTGVSGYTDTIQWRTINSSPPPGDVQYYNQYVNPFANVTIGYQQYTSSPYQQSPTGYFDTSGGNNQQGTIDGGGGGILNLGGNINIFGTDIPVWLAVAGGVGVAGAAIVIMKKKRRK